MFDAYMPFELVRSGIYSYIRHPIYTFNLCVSFGLALSSGIILVAIAASIGFAFVLRSTFLEEEYLSIEYEEYTAYRAKTWRFIPFVF